MTVRVLTVLPDHPLPATTGLHLRMVANVAAVNRLAVEHHVAWFGTSDRPGGSRPDTVLEGCASTVHLADRREQHDMSAVSRVAAKLRYGLAGLFGRASATGPFSMRYDAVDAAGLIAHHAETVGADWVILPSQGLHWTARLGARRVVLDTADVLTDVTRDLYTTSTGSLPRRVGLWLNHKAMAALEGRYFAAADEVWTTTETEARRVTEIAPTARVLAVPNALDESAFRPLPPSSGSTVGLLGTYSYRPNLDAAIELAEVIGPELDRRVEQLSISIAGAGLTDVDHARLERAPRVEVAGRVDDLTAWWSSISLAVLPIRTRGGVPLKLIEALARGRAVVAAPPLVAGLGLREGVEVVVCDTPEDFAREVAALLADDDRRHALEAAGRRAFEREFSWAAAANAVARSSQIAASARAQGVAS